DLALQEHPAALEAQALQEYNAETPWYTIAYGADMRAIAKRAYIRFFVLSPRRWVRLIRLMPWKNFLIELCSFILLYFRKEPLEDPALPEELLPLSRLYSADESVPLTSAQLQRNRRTTRAVQPAS